MTSYKTLFFDVDDTLLDFKAAEEEAITLLFTEHGIPLTEETRSRYSILNQSLWRDHEQGKLDRDTLLNTRFSLFFKELGQEVDGKALGEQYRSYLEKGDQLMDGALETITALKENHDLYIVTNGVSKTQYKRLTSSGLHPLFLETFVSEDTGYQKPMKEFFDYVFARIPGLDRSASLIIGDSLTADIQGGSMSGIDTCWYNPSGKPNDSGIVPTYEIRDLRELLKLLKKYEAETNMF